jgi:hypothetical protein
MKTTTSVAVLVCLSTLATGAAASTDPIVGQHVPSFTTQVIDVAGEAPTTTPFDSAAAKQVTTYMVIGVNCPATQAYAERISQLQKIYGSKGVDFIFVYSNREDTLDRKIAFHRERQLGGRLIDDKGGEVARRFGARRTSELFVANKDGTIVYHGAFDDSRDVAEVKQRYLQMALDEVLAGAPVTISTSPVQA